MEDLDLDLIFGLGFISKNYCNQPYIKYSYSINMEEVFLIQLVRELILFGSLQTL